MKVKFYNIQYQFENDAKYQKEYIHDNAYDDGFVWIVSPEKVYQDQIEYLNTIREVVIDYDNNQFDVDSLLDDLQNETGEYILDFQYEILAD